MNHLCIIFTISKRTCRLVRAEAVSTHCHFGAKILIRSKEIHEYYGRIGPVPLPLMHKELIDMAYKSWFLRSRATEAMNRGTANEEAVLAHFRTCEYVVCAIQTGLLGSKSCKWVVASPDAICLIDVENIPDLHCAHSPIAALVEIKTAVLKNSLQTALQYYSRDINVVDLGTTECSNLIPIEHQLQMLHQGICCSLVSVIYILASESQIPLTVFIIIPPNLEDIGTYSLTIDCGPYLHWSINHSAV